MRRVDTMEKLSMFALLLVAFIAYTSAARPRSCKDRTRQCRQFSYRGYCQSVTYINYMKINCRKTCGFCGRRDPNTCVDLNRNCAYWSRSGECAKNPSYMKDNCCRSCKKKAVVHGGWSSWINWGSCSKTCDQGEQQRTRECNNPRSQNGGRKCSGSATERKTCNLRACQKKVVKPPPPIPPVPPIPTACVDKAQYTSECVAWKTNFCEKGNKWYDFMKENCPKSCGLCTSGGGDKCAANNGGCEQTCAVTNGDVKCSCKDGYIINPDFKICSKVVDGEFSDWSKWSSCTKTCDKGVEKRERSCDSPKPMNGGKDCQGLKKESRYCNTDDCPTGGIAPPMPNSCVDKYGETCKLWATAYCAKGNKWYSFMMEQCRKSCNACDDKCKAANGGCEQVCKINDQDKVECSCQDGFTINPDMKTCSEDKASGATCGKINEFIELGKVIDGQDAFPFKWIWQGGLYYFEEYTCGGALIAPDIFLTAAHCVTGGQSEEGMVIRMGDWNRIKPEEYEQEIGVKRILPHEDWDWGTVHNDIALLKLKKEFKLNKQVGLVCLPKKNYVPPEDATCFITGWGRTSADSDPAEKLQEARLPIVPNDICGKRNVGRDGKSRIIDTMVCGGFQDKTTKVGGCRGDSGGPYVCKNKNKKGNKWELQGVVSWGSSKCDVQQKFTVFTRVSKFIDWIEAKRQEANQ